MGLYYNLITPMASGSQPMQVYELSKEGIAISQATAVVINKTVVFQVAVTLYCGVFSLLNLSVLQNELKSISMFIVFGMVMNIVSLGFGFLAVYNPTLTKKVVYSILDNLTKVKFLKFLENKYEKVDLFIDEYNRFVKMFVKDKKTLVKSLVLTFLQLTIYFSVAFCISKALNLNNVSYVYILSLQVFLYMAVSSLPTPGNIGANEIAFFTIFAGVIPKAFLGYSVFLYGIFVYYFFLVICGLFTIISKLNIKEKLKSYKLYPYQA